MVGNHNISKSLVFRMLLKILIFFLVFNFLFIGVNQFPYGKISLYNFLFSGRERFPFGENPSRSFNLTINNIDAMFSSLIINKEIKAPDEFRVFIIGDSSVWGSFQSNADTLVGQINNLKLAKCRGKTIKTYNLGYPTLSVLKDLLIIDHSLSYQPDLIIWLITLESFPKVNQISSEILKNNPDKTIQIIKKYGLSESYQPELKSFLDQTIIGQRRNLADLIRLQGYGIMWAATGIDQDLNTPYSPAMRDFEEDAEFHEKGQRLIENELSMDIIAQAVKNISIPIILINEPILISNGKNSQIRYNYYYPRWAYDQYRSIMQKEIDELRIPFYDYYDLVPENMYTNSAIHLNKEGESILAHRIASILTKDRCLN
jgi:hypothetical protein